MHHTVSVGDRSELWGFILLLEQVRMSLKKMLFGGSICCSKNLHVPFSINGAVTDVGVTWALIPPYHHRCWLLNFLFLFSLKYISSVISRNLLKCGLVRPKNTFPFFHQSISDELRLREVGRMSGCCWYMACTLHGRVLHLRMQQRTVCTDIGFPKCSGVHVEISVIDSCQ